MSSIGDSTPAQREINTLVDVLTGLPLEVSRRVLSEQLNIVDLVRFDSASLVRKHRQQFQTLYYGSLITYEGHLGVNFSVAQWLASREVYVHKLNLSRSIVDEWSPDLSTIMRAVTSMKVEEKSKLDKSRVTDLLVNCSKLHALCLKDCTLQSDVLQDVVTLCPALQEIDLMLASFRRSDIRPLLSLHLTSLNISACQGIDDATIIAIAESCVSIKQLNANNCSGCTRASIDAIAKHSHQLQHLHIYNWKDLPYESIAGLAAACPDLRGIHFGHSQILCDDGLSSIAAHCTKLQEFTLIGCTNVGIGALVALLSGSPCLQRVWCHASDAAAEALSQHCPCLSTLAMTPAMGTADYSAPVISGAAVAALLRGCSALNHLALPPFTVLPPSSCDFVSPLRELRLSWDHTRTEGAVSSLVSLLPNLRVFVATMHANHSGGVGDEMVAAIAEHCPLLRSADFSGLPRLTDRSMTLLSQRCPLLAHIVFSPCLTLCTDAAIAAIAQNCPQLTSLTLLRSSGGLAVGFMLEKPLRACLTDASIAALAKHSTKLRELDVQEHPQFSKAALSALSAALPKCNIKQAYSSFL